MSRAARLRQSFSEALEKAGRRRTAFCLWGNHCHALPCPLAGYLARAPFAAWFICSVDVDALSVLRASGQFFKVPHRANGQKPVVNFPRQALTGLYGKRVPSEFGNGRLSFRGQVLKQGPAIRLILPQSPYSIAYCITALLFVRVQGKEAEGGLAGKTATMAPPTR